MRVWLCFALLFIVLGCNLNDSSHASDLNSYRSSVLSEIYEETENVTPENDDSMSILRVQSIRENESMSGKGHVAGWQYGPALIRLDGSASIELPPGYRYLPPGKAARSLSPGKRGESVGKIDTLHASIGPEDGSWTAQLVVKRPGYIPANEFINDNATFDLESVRLVIRENETGKMPFHVVSDVFWVDHPSWDASRHRVDWAYMVFPFLDGSLDVNKVGEPALQAIGRPEPKTYYNSLTLGRRDMVMLRTTAIDETATRDMAVVAELALRGRFPDQFRALADGIRFDSDESYADHRAGDRRAKFKLSEFISGEALRAAPSLFDRCSWLASPRLLLGYSLLLMLLLRLRWPRAKKSR
ncbi:MULTISPECIES: DUF2167 domain-containing protein [Burkholderia]|uniref:DUF2167 domain-containing protein n=1 Tax=Burkholderia sola TaxID=2843302 RepID=A0ABV2CHC8_9BURK|nr:MULTISPECIES: DUF2167 domain-containing protein [unclassified Burkholderia]MBP0610514.1 DUF2167 domain-containing protein [Burkholderia sp. CpTa8-5]MBP0711865.1 DUF2167 domain-containing protein [Burkholderia sp. AcTa6-5]